MELFEVRRHLAKRKLSFCREHNLNHLLIGVLLINPDVSTFWNMKRELVESEILSVTSELLFAKLVLSYKSKSNEAFGYRRWLITRNLSKLQDVELTNVLTNELDVCEMAASKNANNYHAWTHRIWCIENIGHRVITFKDILYRELEFSHRWISSHVSEHTGYHYRQYLFNIVRKHPKITNIYEIYYKEVIKILRLVNDGGDPRDILTFLLGKEKSQRILEESINYINFICLLLFDLYNTLEILNTVFPNHESIWYHRRYLMYQLVKAGYDYHGLLFRNEGILAEIPLLEGNNIVNVNSNGEKDPKLFKCQLNKVEMTTLHQLLVKNESAFVKKNSQSTMFHDVEFAKRYEKWLKFIINIEDI